MYYVYYIVSDFVTHYDVIQKVGPHPYLCGSGYGCDQEPPLIQIPGSSPVIIMRFQSYRYTECNETLKKLFDHFGERFYFSSALPRK